MTEQSMELNLLPGNVKKAVAGASSGDLWMVARSQLRFHPKLQPRDRNTQNYKDRVRFIADLIKANGYDRAYPLQVYPAKEDGQDVLYVVQGHRRTEAVDLAATEGKVIESIPCITTDRGTTMEDLIFMTMNGNEGEPLAPIEKANRIKELLSCNVSLETIAARTGYGVGYVKDLLSILETPRDVREMVSEGKVAASVAVKAVKEHGKKAGEVLKAGLDLAKAKGKDKVTPKHLRLAASKPELAKAQGNTPASAANPANPLLDKGLKWIGANDPKNEACAGLLAYLAGVGVEEVKAALEQAY